MALKSIVKVPNQLKHASAAKKSDMNKIKNVTRCRNSADTQYMLIQKKFLKISKTAVITPEEKEDKEEEEDEDKDEEEDEEEEEEEE